ncbi:HAD family hydrolase [Azoarcus sp. KH32C]|uniref:HAD family hydrolase n=1 Tax=Azoarcus sp. KH32C TaxID=748247 RepID=UPI000238680E|nr:HAD family hydrolase [Azoarcus sp. KH32C]BAL23721.1 hypothetical protein AZKH_1399 [Azoarcus sp. KH32C]
MMADSLGAEWVIRNKTTLPWSVLIGARISTKNGQELRVNHVDECPWPGGPIFWVSAATGAGRGQAPYTIDEFTSGFFEALHLAPEHIQALKTVYGEEETLRTSGEADEEDIWDQRQGRLDGQDVVTSHPDIGNGGLNHLRQFDLLLFDLDNTLLESGHLESFRNRENLGEQAAGYYERLLSEARTLVHLIPEELLLNLRSNFPGLRLGVFTRAPKSYAVSLLQCCFPNIHWDCIITFEDVLGRTKPKPDGIFKAALATGVEDMARVAFIGDDWRDLLAAYHAGAHAVLFNRGWGPLALKRDNVKRNEHYRALAQMPDAKLDDAMDLMSLILEPSRFLPALEAWIAGVNGIGQELPMRVDVRNHFNDLDKDIALNWVEVHALGRYFPTTATANFPYFERRDTLTTAILNAKDGMPYPDTWADCCAEYVWNYSEKLLPWDGQLVVCPIPSRPDPENNAGSGRLIELLGRIRDRLHTRRELNISIYNGVLEYRQGAVKNKSLDRERRFLNVRDHLFVANKAAVKGRTVLVLDDVVTSGASFYYASRYLRKAGADDVHCLALAHTIS